MKKQILNGVVWGLMFLSTMTMGYFLGVHDGKKQTINTEAEVSAIYQLLQGMSVSIRTNMNLAVKSAHYLEHSPPLAQGKTFETITIRMEIRENSFMNLIFKFLYKTSVRPQPKMA